MFPKISKIVMVLIVSDFKLFVLQRIEPVVTVIDLNRGHTVIGETLILECKTTFLLKYVSIKWNLPQEVEPNVVKEDFGESTNFTYSKLTIDNVTSRHSGPYECEVVHKKWKHVVHSSRLEVPVYKKGEHAIEFDTQPIFFEGANPEVVVRIKAHPNIFVIWLDHNNQTITGGPLSKFTVSTDSLQIYENYNYRTRLQFKNITSEDFGNYTVVAKNEYGNKDQSFLIDLTSKIVTGLAVDSIIGDRITFKCQTLGFPKPRLEWNFNPCVHYCVVDNKENNYTELSLTEDKGLQTISFMSLKLSDAEGSVYCSAYGDGFGNYSVTHFPDLQNGGFNLVGQNHTKSNDSRNIIYVGYTTEVNISCIASMYTYASAKKWSYGDIQGMHLLTDSAWDYAFVEKLYFKYMTENQARTYTCEALAKNGEIHSRSILVASKKLPNLYPQISLQDMNNGHTMFEHDVRLKCEVIYHEYVSITWGLVDVTFSEVNYSSVRNETVINSTVFVTTSQITINSAGIRGANYSCLVKNKVNPLENHTLVWVPLYGEEESVILFDEKKSLFDKKNMEINVFLLAHPRPTIKWYYNHEILLKPTSKFRFLTKPIPDNKGYKNNYQTTLIFQNGVEFDDFGNYTVAVANEYRQKNYTVLVDVTGVPSVYLELDNVDKTKWESTIKCKGIAYPKVTVKWFFAPCGDLTSCTLLEKKESRHETKGLQYISHISLNLSEKGILKCVGANSLGKNYTNQSISYNNDIDIFAKNIVTRESVRVLESVTSIETSISCAVPSATYQKDLFWYYRDEKEEELKIYPGQSFHESIYSYVTTIIVTHTVTGDYYYTCNGLTKDGSLKSQNLVVKVRDKSYLFINDSNIGDCSVEKHVDLESKWKIYCYAIGYPTPTVKWYKNNQLVVPSKRIQFMDYDQVLEIKEVAREDDGAWKCEAANGFDVRSKSSILTITDPFSWFYVLVPVLLVAIVVIVVIISFNWKLRKENKLVQELKLAGLAYFERGDLKNLNPELALEDQADLLPYDKKWEIPKENIKLGKQLGSGAFGIVVKAEIVNFFPHDSHKVVAVKTVNKHSGFECVKVLASEVKIMGHIGKHVNIVNLLGACTKNIVKKELYVVVEYCHFGNLQNYVQRYSASFIDQKNPETDMFDWKIGPLSQEEPEYPNFICSKDFLVWTYQIAEGMHYLASRRIVHGDLAARNVLLTYDNVVKVSDFGLAKRMYQYGNYVKKGEGPLPVKWLAVESLGKGIFSIQSDVWSFGIVLWEIFSLGETPYPGVVFDETFYKKIINGYRMEQPRTATKAIYRMMLDCWNADPSVRPSFRNLAENIGSLLDESIRNHYLDMNISYMLMNKQQDDYLTMITPPTFKNIVAVSPDHEITKRDYVNRPSISNEVDWNK